MDGDATILEAVISADTPLMAAVRQYEKAAASMAKGNGGAGDKQFQAAMEKMDALQAWDVASEARQLLDVLGVGFYDQRVRNCGKRADQRVDTRLKASGLIPVQLPELRLRFRNIFIL